MSNSTYDSSTECRIAALREAIETRCLVSDAEFDQVYPASQRRRSSVHWTPVDVAMRVSEWLAPSPGGTVLDVGCGVGKACHVGALATDVRWIGVERDAEMVRIASRTARALSIESRTTFIHGDALQVDWSRIGGVYLFNPFTEALFGRAPPDPVLRQLAFAGEVLAVECKLLTLPASARVVTYHGFGGEMPAGFDFVDRIAAALAASACGFAATTSDARPAEDAGESERARRSGQLRRVGSTASFAREDRASARRPAQVGGYCTAGRWRSECGGHRTARSGATCRPKCDRRDRRSELSTQESARGRCVARSNRGPRAWITRQSDASGLSEDAERRQCDARRDRESRFTAGLQDPALLALARRVQPRGSDDLSQ